MPKTRPARAPSKPETTAPLHVVGSILTWTSQAGGISAKKTGEVLAVVAMNERLSDVLGKLKISFKPGQMRATGIALNRRYLVSVPRAGGLSPLFYAPLVKVIDNAKARAKAKAKKRPSR